MKKSKWISDNTLTYRKEATEEYFGAGITIATDRGYYFKILENRAFGFNYHFGPDGEKVLEPPAGDLLCEVIGGPEDGIQVRIKKSDVEVEWISGPSYLCSFLTLEERPCGYGITIEH